VDESVFCWENGFFCRLEEFYCAVCVNACFYTQVGSGKLNASWHAVLRLLTIAKPVTDSVGLMGHTQTDRQQPMQCLELTSQAHSSTACYSRYLGPAGCSCCQSNTHVPSLTTCPVIATGLRL